METLFFIFTFRGMFASGFFSCMLIDFAIIIHWQESQLKKKNRKITDNYDGGNVIENAYNRNQHRS